MATTLTATAEPDGAPPRVLLQLEYTGQPSATIVRTGPDGRAYPVRQADPATLTGGQWIGFDYESPFDQAVTYTATTAAGSLTSAAATLSPGRAWLRHPGIPGLSVPLNYEGDGEPVRAVNQATLDPIGRAYPIVVSDGRRRAPRDQLTLRTYTPAEKAALLAVLADVSILLLDVPPSLGFDGLTHDYVALGDLKETRFRPDYHPHPWRIFTCPYTVVQRPAGGLQAQRTWADVLAGHATWAAVLDDFTTWADVITGATS